MVPVTNLFITGIPVEVLQCDRCRRYTESPAMYTPKILCGECLDEHIKELHREGQKIDMVDYTHKLFGYDRS
jgi:hypothetical protein